MFHHLLQRQLSEAGIHNTDTLPDAQTWQQFLQLVNESYHRADDYLLYRALFDQTNDAVFIATLETPPRILTANQRASEMLGYARSEFPGLSLDQIVPQIEMFSRRKIWADVLSGNPLPPFEHTFLRKDGFTFPVEINIQLVRDEEAHPLYVQSVVRDISERKETENTLHYQATLIDQIQDAVYSTNLDETVLTWNEAAERMYGWTAAEAIGQFSGKMVGSHLTSKQRSQAVQQIKDLGRWEAEIIHTARNGTPIPVLVTTSLLTDAAGKPSGFIAICHDMTERKKEQEALRQSEERYRKLFIDAQWQAQELALLNQARSAVASETDLDALIQVVVEAFAKIFGYAYISLYLKEGDRLILQYQLGYEAPLPEIHISQGVIGRVVRLGEAAFITDPTQDPDFVYALSNVRAEIAVPLFNRDQVVGVFNIETIDEQGLTQDDLRLMSALSEQLSVAIERARLYTNLRETKEQYQAVLDSIREVVFQTDMNFNWTFLNPAWTEIMGFSLSESVGKSFLQFVHPDDRKLNSQSLVTSQQGTNRFWRYQLRYITQSGAVVWLETHAQILFGADGTPLGTIGTLTDVTERKLNEQQAAELAAQGKIVESLHRFLGNVSHDLRTPLSIMSTSLYLIRRKLGTALQDTHYLDVLEKQILHLSRIVDDLVEVSRLEDAIVQFEFISVPLGSLIRDVAIGRQTALEAKNLTLNLDIQDDLPTIQADQVWIGRAIRNLLMNATEYTSEGGVIDVRVHQQDEHVLIEVQDTGIGIAPEHAARIFERFYRADESRPSDKGGTGLGLTIVRKVAEAHGGSVTVESTLGQGSTFRLWIPISR